MSDGIRVNDNAYSWGSLILIYDDQRYYGFTAVSWSEKREYVAGYGMTRAHAPILRSGGKYSVENLKVTGWRHSVMEFKKALAAKAPDQRSYGNIEFHGLLQYIEADQTEITTEFHRLRYAANSVSHEENPDPLKCDLELSCLYVVENQLTLFDSSQGMP